MNNNSVPNIPLRDYIAIHATEKDIEPFRKPQTERLGPYVFKSYIVPIERARYAYADAMLEARNE